MAEGPSSAKQALEKLNEQLICPICLDHYTDPKLLQCFHVFCEKCLKPVAHQTPQGQVVECPNCRQPTSLPQNGVSGLQGAFLIHHLFDIQDILKKVSTPADTKCVKCEKREPTCYCRTCGFLCDSCKKPHVEWKEFSSHEIVSLDKLTEDVTNLVPPVQKVLYCSKHPAKELDLYCETCKEVICRDCILKVHRDHQYDLATDVFPQQKNVLIASVEPAEQQLASVNKALEGLDTLCGKITSQRQDLEVKIKENFHLIHKVLEARQEELIAHLENRRSFGSFGSGPDQLNRPVGVTFSATGDILVADQRNHCIQIFSPDGKSVKCVGVEGNEPLQFFYLVGVAIHPHSNKIYATDCNNHRVQILNTDLTFCSIFGSKGSGNGQFQRPIDISFDSSGNVYVTDRDNHRVQVFTPEGEYVRQFGKKGSGKGELNEPKGIAIDSNDIVYVCDWNNHRISLFTQDGHFLRSFGTQGEGAGQFNNPSGITIANNGVVYISDTSNKRVQVF